MTIATYIAEEVERQGYARGTKGFLEACINMGIAWGYMKGVWEEIEELPLRPADIGRLGQMVNPSTNNGDFRSIGVRVGFDIKPSHFHVPRLMKEWCDAVNDHRFTANEAYLEFENIHPFVDGNGRTGKIIFNWLNGTLDSPVLPKVPKEWSIP